MDATSTAEEHATGYSLGEPFEFDSEMQNTVMGDTTAAEESLSSLYSLH